MQPRNCARLTWRICWTAIWSPSGPRTWPYPRTAISPPQRLSTSVVGSTRYIRTLLICRKLFVYLLSRPVVRIRIHCVWIRIHYFRLNRYRSGCGSNPDPGFWWLEIGKNLQLEKNLIFFWSKIANYLSLGLHQVRPCYRRSLQPSKENIQNFKKWNFINFFLFVWVIFALLDPDLDSESGSTDLIETGSGSETLIKTYLKCCWGNHFVRIQACGLIAMRI